MKLYIADYHLEMTHLLSDKNVRQILSDKNNTKTNYHLFEAKRIINNIGYGRRQAEVNKLNKKLGQMSS